MAEPGEDGEDGGGRARRHTVRADHDQDVDDEERQPAEDEQADDEAERSGSALLLQVFGQMLGLLLDR